ncbi:MAG: MoaD/ThiS family protein [Desulfobacterales bacterium]|jgi:molybdopterin converting factor small subunit
MMKVSLVCFSKLAQQGACEFQNTTPYELDDGQTVKDLAVRAGISWTDIKLAFVNSRIVDFETVLNDGDRVGLAPAVGGM